MGFAYRIVNSLLEAVAQQGLFAKTETAYLYAITVNVLRDFIVYLETVRPAIRCAAHVCR
jgi:hypothetical protein